MFASFAALRAQGLKKKKATAVANASKTTSPLHAVISGVPVKNYWNGLLKTPKKTLTPANKLKNMKDVYSPDKLPATVYEIPTEGDTPSDDGFTMIVKPDRNVNTSRHGQEHRRSNIRVRKSRVKKPSEEKMKLPPPKPIKMSHVLPKEVIQPHGEMPMETKSLILPYPVPSMPDRSEFKLNVDGVWKDTTHIKEEEPELPVASMEHIFTTCFKLLTWMFVCLVPVDQEIDDLPTFSREIDTLYELVCEQNDFENQLKLERLKVCLEKIRIYSDYLQGFPWMSHKTSHPKDQEQGYQNLAVWFYEIMSIYQDMACKQDGFVVRTGYEKQALDLATNNLLKGGFFTLLPHFLGDENGYLRSVFDDKNLEKELLSEKRISARILLQFVIWILPHANREENVIRLTKFVKKVMSWNDKTDSLTHLMGQVFSN